MKPQAFPLAPAASSGFAALDFTEMDLKEIAGDVVARAAAGGASAAEAVAREDSEFATVVRLGEVESLKESGSRAIGVRVFFGQRTASTYSSDLSPQGLQQMVEAALALARVTSDDPFAGLPQPGEYGAVDGDLDLYYEDVYSLSTAGRIDYARRAENASMAVDPRIRNSEGGSFEAAAGTKVLATSTGFLGEYRRSHCSVSAVPVAQDERGAMQRDYWYSVARSLSRLESPEHVGQVAAQRTLRRLGARKVKTARVPVVFDPQTARALLAEICDAVNGDMIYRGASFLAGKLGEQIAGGNVTIIDDGAMPGGFGSSPFDGEGAPSRRTLVIEHGRLQSYLLNSYTARKLGLKTTGNASRGLAGNPGITCGNFFLQPGESAAGQIIAGISEGLYLTEFLGFGVNLVTGDFSRGAGGLWIRNGELAFPVEEITVAGNLKDMLRNISEIGNDLEFRGAVASPTLRIDGMTVAGE
jgi:PmbA protein